MNKLLYTLAFAGLFAPALSARTLSVDEAKANVAAFSTRGMLKAPALNADIHPVGSMAHEGVTTLYLFSGAAGQGLVVASASDLTAPILGYADCGTFDMASIPPSMQALLEDYSAEIAMAEAGQIRKTAAKEADGREAVAPLCKTQWNQNAPYNDLVPTLSDQKCMTGCVATAMAQVMKSFEWPAEHGEGFVSYRWEAGGKQLTYNLANSTMDWANMLDHYDSEATDAQKTAVASLMRDCGYATNMQYSLSASGTTANTIPTALHYNFGYDKTARSLQRAYYTSADWENIIYEEIKNGRPVIITGVSNARGGHCFVCDGYSSDRYFHINWGWGGMSDGYFLLSALTPETQGIGGSTGGFNNYVNICLGIQKPAEGSEYFTELLGEGGFKSEAANYQPGAEVVFVSQALYNPALITENFQMGVKLTDAQGNVQYIQAPQKYSLDPYTMISQYSIPASSFPADGTYTVTAAWYNTDTEKWDDVHYPIYEPSSMTLTATSGSLTFASIPVDVNIKAEEVKLLTDLYTNAKFRVSAKLVNYGDTEYLNEIMAAVIDADNKIIGTSAPFNVDVEPGQSLDIDFVTEFTRAPAPGTYRFCFVDTKTNILSEPFEVELTAVTGSTSIKLEGLRMTSGNGDSTPTVPSNDVSLAGTVNCLSGYFNGDISAYIFPQRGGNSLGTIGTETFFLHADETQGFEMHGSFGNGVEGATYMVGFFNGQNQIPNTVLYFVLGAESGITKVEAPENVSLRAEGDQLHLMGADAAEVYVYSTDGALVLSAEGRSLSLAPLASGTYIAVAYTAEGPVMLKFVR